MRRSLRGGRVHGRVAPVQGVLRAVIAINAGAFAVVTVGSLAQGSAALAANGLDFLGDAATYAISLWTIGRSAATRASAALFKGGTLAVAAVAVLGFAVWRALSGVAPEGLVISGLGLFGVAANLVAAALLLRYREGDANVRSVWLCTRNDLVNTAAVAVTGVVVWLTGSRWPDLAAGVVLAALFLQSAWSITVHARRELAAVNQPMAAS